LLDAVEIAEAQAEATYSRIVAEASTESWQAAAWWLERRKHEDYARRDKSEMTIDVKREAARIAEEMGMDVDEVLAEAQRIFADAR
jgi:CTP-dependent riboflavin kinase